MINLSSEVANGLAEPLFQVSWEEDRLFRMNPKVVTALLREQVPVLDFVEWKVVSIEPGTCESVLPLNPQSTNQHFTHQAALCVLAADYTGGTALASLLAGWPVVGVHPVKSPQSASLWLLKVEIKYLRPSVGDLTVRARVDPALHERVRKRFTHGQAVIETIGMELCNGSTRIAEASLTYFARQSDRLRTDSISTARVNSLYELKLTSSAELIAGVRATQSGRLFRDDFAARMAGQHGMALAQRFCERSPQLGGMIAARTWHLDGAIERFLSSGGRDLVILGVGWDMRPFRMSFPEGTRIYELDFCTTLAERAKRLGELGLGEPAGVTRFGIPIDLRATALASALSSVLPPESPVFVAWEGMSMYFQEQEVREIMAGILPLLRRQESLLWVDLVDRHAIEHPEQIGLSVANFMRGMQILGEPFTFGAESVEEFMGSVGLRTLEVISSDVCVRGRKDPVYEIYRFCVATALSTDESLAPRTFGPTRFDRRSRAIRTAPRAASLPRKGAALRSATHRIAANLDPLAGSGPEAKPTGS